MTLRASAIDDQGSVLRLLADRDLADFGRPDFTAPLIMAQWRSQNFVPAQDAVVVEDGSDILGYAAVFAPGDLVFVHPEREGEGIGTQLLSWAEERARPRGTFRQRVAASNHSGRSFLESARYQRVRSVCYLAWSGEPELPTHSPPDGIALEPIDFDRDSRELHELDMLAFSQNPDHQEEPFEAFRSDHLSDPDVHQTSSRVARQHGRAVGFVLCRRSENLGYVDLLAVDPASRRTGLGRTLLHHALRTLASDGAPEVCLDVSSDNHRALNLYRSVGMSDRHEVVVFEKAAGQGGSPGRRPRRAPRRA
jgi:mycothiol synthase